jgi:hypothetical protein
MGGQYSMDILSGDEAALMSDRISVFSDVPGGDAVIPVVKRLQTAIGANPDGNYGAKTDAALRTVAKNHPATKLLPTTVTPTAIILGMGGKINGYPFSASEMSQIHTAWNAWKAKPATGGGGTGGGTGGGAGGGGGGSDTELPPPPELDESGMTGWLKYWWIPVVAIGLFAVAKIVPKMLKKKDLKKEGLSTVSGCDCGR